MVSSVLLHNWFHVIAYRTFLLQLSAYLRIPVADLGPLQVAFMFDGCALFSSLVLMFACMLSGTTVGEEAIVTVFRIVTRIELWTTRASVLLRFGRGAFTFQLR